MQKLNGPFKDIIPILIKMKKSIGYKYDNINVYIELDKYLFNKNIIDMKNNKEIFVEAIEKENNEYLKIKRYYALENLNLVIKNIGLKEIEMKKIFFKSKEKFIAKVLNEKEVTKLFETIDILSKDKPIQEKLVYRTFYRLIYSTGLRISEAINLIKAHYSRENGVLLIEKSKNNITRNVCLSISMKKIFDEYLDQINIKEEDKIFNITETKIRDFFKLVIITASLEPCRIHDLRHTFAVTALDNLLENMEEYKALYLLQTFMGHKNITSTEYYLKLTKKQIKSLREKEEEIDEYIFGGNEDE